MSRNPSTLTLAHAGRIFPALFLILYGAVFLETWALCVKAGILPQAIIALTTLAYLSALNLRYRRTAALAVKPGAEEAQQPMKALSTGKAVWFILMLLIGYVFAQLVAFGFVTPMVFLVMGMIFLPWCRACSCNRDFYTSGVLMALGAAYPALFADPYGSQISLLIAGWVLWMGALVAFFRKP